jgi:uncharacterized ParB-like nuclease family protein
MPYYAANWRSRGCTLPLGDVRRYVRVWHSCEKVSGQLAAMNGPSQPAGGRLLISDESPVGEATAADDVS